MIKMRHKGTVSLFITSIVNDLYRASGLNFDEHYKKFFQNGVAVIEKDVDELQQVILSAVRNKLEHTNMFEMYGEKVKPRNTSLIDKEMYCKGFNDCLAEHRAVMGDINEIILYAVQSAMENIGVQTADTEQKESELLWKTSCF
jgi:hypothetical protein